jgi:putative DNA primase/helicase
MNNTATQPKTANDYPSFNITADDILNDIKSISAVKVKAHETILDEFLTEIEAVDFREILNIDEESKIQQKHLVVLTIDEILRLIKLNDFGLCAKNDFVYLFNGAFWKPIDREEFRSFLGKASARLGINEIDSKHFAFRDSLYKQFVCAADAPKIKETEKTLVNLLNGTLEVSTTGFHLREHRREDFLTYQLQFAFESKTEYPRFRAYLERVLPDAEMQNILAEYIAYCFTRHLKLEKCLFLFGAGANGKSVFFDIITALLGSENITSFSLNNLNEEHNRALMNNKLLNYSSELGGKKAIDSDLFKKLVSVEPVQCRLKYGQSFFSVRYAKLMFNCNELPRDVEFTHAFFRRFLIIPFSETIPENEQDAELAQKIINSEFSGVFNWILDGLNRLLKNKRFSDSDTVRKMLKDFREQSDSVHLFLSENDYQKSTVDYIPLKELFNNYRQFCLDDNFRALNKTNFTKRLEAQNVQVEDRNFGKAVFLSTK